MIRVGVTGTGSLIGQAIIKSIRASCFAAEARIVGFDYFPETVGSAWVAAQRLLPDVLDAAVPEEQWVDAVVDALAAERLQLLLIGVDFELPLFARHAAAMERATGCRIVVSDPRVVAIADDKHLTARFLAEQGLPHPQTYLPAEIPAGGIPFPAVVKPRSGSRSRDVFLVRGEAELAARLAVVPDPVVQELAGEADQEYTCGVIYFDHEVRGLIALRRELRDGTTVTARFSRSAPPPAVHDFLRAAAAGLEPYGACNFQLRIDAAGTPKLFEINARHSGTTHMRSLFGFREVEYVMGHVLGRETPPFALREGVVKRYFEELYLGAAP